MTLHCSPQHGRLRPTSQPRKSQQIAPSYLNPIICTGHSAVHCGKVRGIILARGYHLITYSHLVAKTNLSAKSWGSTHQVVVQKKASLHSFSLEVTKKAAASPGSQPVVLPHEEDVEAGEEGLLVDAEVPGHEVLSVVCGGVVHDSAVLLCDVIAVCPLLSADRCPRGGRTILSSQACEWSLGWHGFRGQDQAATWPHCTLGNHGPCQC